MFGSTGSLGSRPHWPGRLGQRHGKAECAANWVAQASRNPQRQGYYNDATVTILK